ncbi:MAG: dipeptidase [Novosphingobium sp.]|jgi:membrane dipeptidase|nr:dipeptidase [Novosphingobium sp.]
MRKAVWLAGFMMLGLTGPTAAQNTSPEAVAAAALKAAPVWDGHNDVPDKLRDMRRNVLGTFDFSDTRAERDPTGKTPPFQTDIARLRAGKVGAQFWSVYVSAALSEPQAVQATLEQIDVMKRIIARHQADLAYCETADCAARAMKDGRIASLLGIEGGHSIGTSLSVLRQMHALGVRYMTLTHTRNNAWADAGTDTPVHGGLTDLGRDVVREMNRLGMLVDLSHVSEATMLDTLDVTKAPLIFSHSNATAINQHARNVPDSVLDRLKANGGIVMVNFYPPFVSEDRRQWNARRAAEKARLDALNLGNPKASELALEGWVKANPAPNGGIADVANHLDHIKRRIGAAHVGIGGDFDGIDVTVDGLGDASTYPALFVELARRGWTRTELEGLASGNMMRVMKAAEAYAASRKGDAPIENPVSF